MKKKIILVTGATGFVGSALVKSLVIDCSIKNVLVAVRQIKDTLPKGVLPVQVGDLLPTTDWSVALSGVDAVVHCAARVHITKDSSNDPLDVYRQVNVHGTLNLAKQAARAKVRRFVFISTIKVNGEITQLEKPFTIDDIPAPSDPYGISKLEAELGLQEIARKTGMEVVIVRPPLVYGPGVKANFQTMIRWVRLGLPLPLGSIHNARSMVFLGNLIDLLIVCLKRPEAAGQTFLVSDGEDLSTTNLLRQTAKAMGKNSFLIPMPVGYLEFFLSLMGKRSIAQRLCSSLQVDIERTRCILGWNPPFTLAEGLQKTVEVIKC